MELKFIFSFLILFLLFPSGLKSVTAATHTAKSAGKDFLTALSISSAEVIFFTFIPFGEVRFEGPAIRVVAIPDGMKDIKSFIQAVINPVSFNSIEITPDEVIVTAGPQNKAALLGRNKRRLDEMQGIIANFFKIGYRVI